MLTISGRFNESTIVSPPNYVLLQKAVFNVCHKTKTKPITYHLGYSANLKL